MVGLACSAGEAQDVAGTRSHDSLGVVHFPNSAGPAAQPAFLNGVRLLHSFEYGSAAEAFREAQRMDRSFALAYWGEALTHFHLLWEEEDLPAARAVLQRLAPSPAARRASAPSERERLYLDAVERLAGEGSKPARLRAYADAMGRLAQRHPDDLEARALYALAILGTQDGSRDVPTYMRAAAVAEEVFAEQPRHPGAAHYLIHAYDDPAHAPLGLRAARVYADLAPDAPHALHMPAHIFLALGDWDRVIALNRASAEAARAGMAAGGGDGLGARNHALYWLSYALAQLDRFDEARQVVAFLENDAQSSGNGGTRWHATAARAALLVDLDTPDPETIRAAVAVESGSGAAVASYLAATLAARQQGSPELTERLPVASISPNASPAVRVMELERLAIALMDSGTLDSTITLLERAAEIEDEMPIQFGPPVVVKPAHELLGEVLLRAGRVERAADEFRRALERTPNRRRARQGLEAAERAFSDQGAAQAISIGEPDRGVIAVNRTPLGSWAYFIPPNPATILVLAHGYPWPDDSRTQDELVARARSYVERWRQFAEEHGLILIAPAFGSGDLAGYRELAGKRIDADQLVLALVREHRRLLPHAFDSRFYLYGHSAGGQFASRFLVAHPGRLAGVVLSAPGTFPWPEPTIAWPYGMGPATRDALSGTVALGKPPSDAAGARYAPDPNGWTTAGTSVPVRVVVGTADTEPRDARPGQVGDTRVERAVAWVKAMNRLALSRGDTGTTALRFVPDVGHDPVALTAAAQRLFTLMLGAPDTRETVLDSVASLVDTVLARVPEVPRPDATGSTRVRPVTARGVRFFVREEGAGTPLVLIPGGPGNTQQSFHPHFGAAAEFARVIYYDPRGTGDSDWTPGPQGYSTEQAVDDLEALRATLGIDRWVVLGWSFGGLLAQRYALRFPERVQGLVLVSTSLPMEVDIGEADGRRYMSAPEVSAVRAMYRDGGRTVVPVHSDAVDLVAVRRLVYNAYVNGEWKRQFYFRPSFVRMAQVAHWEWRHDRNYTTQVNASGFARDLTGAFRDWATPTLIVEGRWDPTWGAAKPQVLRAQFPRAHVHVLEGASHNGFAEQPERFFDLLRQFIESSGRSE
jgi:proline-specific peptidase